MAYPLEVQVIEGAVWLPYWPSYAAWTEHREGDTTTLPCPVCSSATSFVGWSPDDLCPVGWSLEQELGDAIENQKILAGLN